MNTGGKTIQKVFIVTGLIAVLGIVVYVFMYVDIHGKNKQIAESSGAIENFRESEKEFRAVEDVFSKTENDRNKLISYFISPEGSVPFFEFVERLARSKSLDVEIESVAVSEEPILNSTYTQELVIEAHVTGAWNNVLTFIELLETMPYQVRIDATQIKQVYVSCSECDSDVPTWEGRVVFRVLKLK